MKKKFFNTQNLVLIALFAAITAVVAPFSIPLPFAQVPLSLSVFAVFLCGAVLDKYSAFFAQTVYVLLGAFGLPIFAGFTGGLGVIAGKTGGYIFAYAFMAFIIALILEKAGKNYITYAIAMILSLVICYLFGVVWLDFVTKIGFYKAFIFGAVPFIPFDIAKALICALVAVAVNKSIKRVKVFN
jgi:biotin transport system substrate-specific component